MPVVEIGGSDRKISVDAEALKLAMRVGNDKMWMMQNREKLAKDFKNQWIAVIDREVLYSDSEFKNLKVQIEADGKKTDAFAIGFISAEKPHYCFEEVEILRK
jgi:hypothetical protein